MATTAREPFLDRNGPLSWELPIGGRPRPAYRPRPRQGECLAFAAGQAVGGAPGACRVASFSCPWCWPARALAAASRHCRARCFRLSWRGAWSGLPAQLRRFANWPSRVGSRCRVWYSPATAAMRCARISSSASFPQRGLVRACCRRRAGRCRPAARRGRQHEPIGHPAGRRVACSDTSLRSRLAGQIPGLRLAVLPIRWRGGRMMRVMPHLLERQVELQVLGTCPVSFELRQSR